MSLLLRSSGAPASAGASVDTEKSKKGRKTAPRGSEDGVVVDDEITAGTVVVDRARLVSRLAAEARLANMANHLGWAEPIRLDSIPLVSSSVLQTSMPSFPSGTSPLLTGEP